MPRSRKNKKGILEVGFFIELKNRHIIQRLPVTPKRLARPPNASPLPSKPKGMRRRKVGNSKGGNAVATRNHL